MTTLISKRPSPTTSFPHVGFVPENTKQVLSGEETSPRTRSASPSVRLTIDHILKIPGLANCIFSYLISNDIGLDKHVSRYWNRVGEQELKSWHKHRRSLCMDTLNREDLVKIFRLEPTLSLQESWNRIFAAAENRFPHLTRLDMPEESDCPQIVINSPVETPHLHTLRVCSWNINSDSLKSLFLRLSHLHTLTFEQCMLDKNSLSALNERGCRWISLNLSRSHGLKESALSEIASACTSLRELNISGCYWVNEDGLGALRDKCTCLTSLNIGSCRTLDNDTAFSRLGFASLRTLNVSRLSCIDQTNATTICKTSPLLTSLDISQCYSVDQAIIQTFAKGLLYLNTLSVSHCHGFNKDCVEALGLRAQTLTDLDISFCIEINQRSLEVVPVACPRLTSLNISGCSQVDEAILQTFAVGISTLQNLTNIQVAFCPKVTQEGVRSLARASPSLKSLSLFRSAISDKSMVDSLREEFPHIGFID